MNKYYILISAFIAACGSKTEEKISPSSDWSPCNCDEIPPQDVPGSGFGSGTFPVEQTSEVPLPNTSSSSGSNDDNSMQDAGVQDSSVVDSGDMSASKDAGSDKNDHKKDEVCGDNVPRTCEQQLYCCNNNCKFLNDSSEDHVHCVQKCADDHRECAKDRRPSCYKKKKS